MKYRIAIWGAGNFGQYIYCQLRSYVIYFIDENPELTGEKIDNIEIIHPDFLKYDSDTAIDFVLVAFLGGISVYDKFKQYENIKFGIVKDCVFRQKLKIKNDLQKENNIFWVAANDKPLLYYLETNIVDCCNLNCKGCSHFSNLYNLGEMIPYETYCKDLKQISEKVNVLKFRMLGGEAFLNTNLIDYIKYTREIMPYSEIEIVTNGLLLPRQSEEFFLCCERYQISVEISEYKPTTNVKDQIIEVLSTYDIAYHFTPKIDKFGKNIVLSGNVDNDYAMKHCREHDCHFFRQGKIYKCPFEALGNKFFEHYNLDIRLQGGIDIYDEKIEWDNLVFLLNNRPVDSCKYCGDELVFEWEVSSKPIMEDWII